MRTLLASTLGLGAFASASLAEPLELKVPQMDAITAGENSVTQSNSVTVSVTASNSSSGITSQDATVSVTTSEDATVSVTTSEDATVNQIVEESPLWTRVVVEVLSQQPVSD
jgi:hypothetical protein